jgi:hypothetical protein
MKIKRTTANKMTETQLKIAGKIAALWPEAEITEYDAGVFCATVSGDDNFVSHQFPAKHYGVCVGNVAEGKSRIDF